MVKESNPAIPPRERRHLWITGQVQGVGYRWATHKQAQQLALSGWVRNLPDGRVEAVFEGSALAVEQMVSWCQQGPPAAIVAAIEQVDDEPIEGILGFTVMHF